MLLSLHWTFATVCSEEYRQCWCSERCLLQSSKYHLVIDKLLPGNTHSFVPASVQAHDASTSKQCSLRITYTLLPRTSTNCLSLPQKHKDGYTIQALCLSKPSALPMLMATLCYWHLPSRWLILYARGIDFLMAKPSQPKEAMCYVATFGWFLCRSEQPERKSEAHLGSWATLSRRFSLCPFTPANYRTSCISHFMRI